ncbi:17834_t:CDS:2 [Entrophospora sp. SA101]|nr:17834_t:CDS:2 [Entrophospora sp. SA101]
MCRKELSVAQCEQIIGAYISGIKQKVISAQFNIPTSSATPEKMSWSFKTAHSM